MQLLAGTRLGPYVIESLLGVGGMGEVYRATDTRLDRQVAIKVLPDGSGADASHRARFQREAKAISALNHAHICALHDVGLESGTEFLVLELLEGETLAARLARGRLPISQVVRLGGQIADALAAAHHHGIVHRDLKPANVMLTASGVKLLDFGLAKPVTRVSPEPLAPTVVGEGPTTSEGTIIGTLQYMAPEQVQGQSTDARTDIFALGLLLHEMATGRKAFDASTQARLIASILDTDPPRLSSLVPLAPPALEQVIDRCLAKEPADRWQSAHDVKLQLEWLQSHGSGSGAQAAVTTSRRRPWLLPLSAGVAGAAVAAIVAALSLGSATPTAPVPMRFELALSEETHLQGESTWDIPRLDMPEISPDGRRIAYSAMVSGRRQLLVRDLASSEATVLVGNEDATLPFWSPDSRSLGYFAGRALKRISIAGGAPQVLAPVSVGAGGTWRNGNILFAPSMRGTIYSIPDTGGTATPVSTLPPSSGPAGYGLPRFLPDGRTFLLTVLGEEALCVASLDVPGVHKVANGIGPWARFAQGHLLFPQGGRLFARPFDLRRREFSGPEVLLAEPARSLSVSDNGTVVYLAQPAPSWQLTWYSRNGDRSSIADDAGQYRGMALSPTGRRAAVWRVDHVGNLDIWEVDLQSGVHSRLTNAPEWDTDATWAPDDQRMAFTSRRSGRPAVYVKDLVTGHEEQVSRLDEALHVDTWTPDGRAIVARTPGRAVYLVELVGEWITRLLVTTPYAPDEHDVSPDGNWVAFNSQETGQFEVYIAAYPDFTSRRQVSSGGGVQPHWRGDGRELFYLRPDASMMSVPLRPGPVLEVGPASVLFATNIRPDGQVGQYGVTPDGQRFLGLSSGDRRRDTFAVLVNWLTPDHLERQVR